MNKKMVTIGLAMLCFSRAVSTGEFQGQVVTEWLQNDKEDRDMRLLEDFKYIDDNGKVWSVPKGQVVNGASIPQTFWTFGPPFVGDYRRASVVHDHYCRTRTESWEDVHRMFYEAMQADGVPSYKAKVMYAAVYAGGPRWDEDGNDLSSHESLLSNVNLVDEILERVEEGELDLNHAKIDIDKLISK
ncbi:DUF1353 domain-containing protein [Candidatus Thiosymbion oneisti]|uniref:DUF1353 domain-containing protein n=1 Tax=Candidatus Thiosymbion oneisti TaxID=589554 RepID=UPI000B7C6FED|nr:DUF1353 domain-containing protein [Candidatus Thiosymbion oneisti]